MNVPIHVGIANSRIPIVIHFQTIPNVVLVSRSVSPMKSHIRSFHVWTSLNLKKEKKKVKEAKAKAKEKGKNKKYETMNLVTLFGWNLALVNTIGLGPIFLIFDTIEFALIAMSLSIRNSMRF